MCACTWCIHIGGVRQKWRYGICRTLLVVAYFAGPNIDVKDACLLCCCSCCCWLIGISCRVKCPFPPLAWPWGGKRYSRNNQARRVHVLRPHTSNLNGPSSMPRAREGGGGQRDKFHKLAAASAPPFPPTESEQIRPRSSSCRPPAPALDSPTQTTAFSKS